MHLQMLYALLVFSLFTVTSSCLLDKQTRNRCPIHSLDEIIAGINYIHHEPEEKFLAYKRLQRRNLAPKINTNGSLSEYETLEKLFDAGENSWSYSAQDRWPETYPSCGGNYQSPIDLVRPSTPSFFLPPMEFTNYDIEHPNLRVDISQHSVDASADWVQVPTITGGALYGDYRLASVHWHWGINNTSGSEHSISQSKYVLELHAVHYDARYRNIDEAINAIDREALAVLAIFYTLSTESNPGMTNIVNVLQNGPSPSDSLLLSDFKIGPSPYYYTYTGSLTAPPCHQVVRWIVMETPETITESELNVIRDLSYNGKRIGPNYRQIQPTNGRAVYHDLFSY